MGNFTFNKTDIEGVYLIDVKTYGDVHADILWRLIRNQNFWMPG